MDPLCKRSCSKRMSPTPPPWNPGSGCDIVLANPWGSPRPLGPPLTGPTYPVSIMISPTCPQHGRLFQRNKSRCSALLDGLPADTFTIKMTFTVGLCKLFCGIVIFLLGLTALPFEATLAGIGSGLWAGMVTLISGVAGLMSSKLPQNYAVLITFLCCSITSLATSTLLVIFSATGLTKDLSYDDGRVADVEIIDTLEVSSSATTETRTDDESSHESVFVSFDELFKNGRPAVIINSALITLAIVDCLVSIMAIALASSETCVCCFADGGTWGTRASKESRVRHDRLLRWIQQQRLRLSIQPPPETLHHYDSTLMRNNTSTGRRGPEPLDSMQTCSSPCRSFLSDTTTNSAISVDSLNKKRLTSNSNCQLVAPTTTTDIMATTTDTQDSLTDQQILSTYSELDRHLANDFIRRSLKGS